LLEAIAMSARKLFAAALFILVSPLALAHAHLTDPVPAADTTVGAPKQLSLGFSEPVELGFSQVTLTTANGDPVALQPLTSAADDRKTLLVKPAAALAAGQYTVQWKVVSVDTHKSAGEYRFTVSP
jgi:methionine-rich copper-binding protein CopC